MPVPTLIPSTAPTASAAGCPFHNGSASLAALAEDGAIPAAAHLRFMFVSA